MTVDVPDRHELQQIIGAGNGEIAPRQTFKEQILWFAENVVVPEGRKTTYSILPLITWWRVSGRTVAGPSPCSANL